MPSAAAEEPAASEPPADPRRAYPLSAYRSSRATRFARRRVLPWSERSVLAVSLLLVLLSTPLWLDPSALYELGWGRPSATDAAATSAPPRPRPTTVITPGVTWRVIARDTFSRRSADGWGTADEGGSYAIDGQARGLSVEPGVGIIGLAGGDAGGVRLVAVSAQDVSLDVSLAIERRPAAGGLRLYAELRGTPRGGAYLPFVEVRADGSLLVGGDVRRGGTHASLASTYVVPDVALADGDVLRMRAEAVGSDPTTIRLRVWRSGEPEPEFWHVSAVDWSGALQQAGAAGIGWRLDETAGEQLALRVDDLSITTSDGGDSQ